MDGKPAVLLVDHNASNVQLLSSFLTENGYPTHAVSSMEDLDEVVHSLQRRANVALALVDLTGFAAAIWERCRHIAEAGVAVVVVAHARSVRAADRLYRQSRMSGATHTLTKPLRKEQLLTLVRILTGTDD